MTEIADDETLEPRRLAAVLALFLAPGAASAVYLWHGVINPVLAGRPVRAPWAAVAAAVLVLGGVVAALARYLRRVSRQAQG